MTDRGAFEQAQGTFECPICGLEHPHAHSENERIRWHQVYRPIFERMVYEQMHAHGSAIYTIDKTDGYCLTFPAESCRDGKGWGTLDQNGEYALPWVQALWTAFKEGTQAALAYAREQAREGQWIPVAEFEQADDESFLAVNDNGYVATINAMTRKPDGFYLGYMETAEESICMLSDITHCFRVPAAPLPQGKEVNNA